MVGDLVERLMVGLEVVVNESSFRTGLRAADLFAKGVAIAGAATIGFTLAQAAAIDDIAKTARTLDLTTEAYSEYAFAAELSDVTNEQFKTSLRALTVQIGSAAAGSKEAGGNFAAMGIHVRKANGDTKTAAELLPEVADALANMSDEGERAALRARLLGESGSEMATLLMGGAAGIEAMRREAAALGLTVSTETAEAAEGLNDNLTRLKGVMKGAALQIGGLLIPAAESFTDWMVKASTASDGFIRLSLDRVLRGVGLALDFLDTPAGKVVGTMTGVVGVIGALKTVSSIATPALGLLGGGFGTMTAAAMPWLLVGAAIALVLEDIWVTANGGDSIIRRIADAFGYGEETAEFFRNTIIMVNKAIEAFVIVNGEGLTLVVEWTKAFIDFSKAVMGAAWAVGDFLTFGALQAAWDFFGRDPWQLPLPRFMLWLWETFNPSAAIEGFTKLARFASGDRNVELARGGPEVVGAQLIAAPYLALAGSARERGREQQQMEQAIQGRQFQISGLGGAPGGEPQFNMSFEFNGDANRSDLARRVGQEAERGYLRAIDDLDGR